MVSSTPRTQREACGGGGKKWKLGHLPKGTSEVFTNQLVPLAKSLAGSLSPWEGLSRKQVQELVDKIYGSAQHEVFTLPRVFRAESEDSPWTLLGLNSDFFWLKQKPN